MNNTGRGAQGLFQRRVRVETIGIEDIDLLDAYALQALVQAGDMLA